MEAHATRTRSRPGPCQERGRGKGVNYGTDPEVRSRVEVDAPGREVDAPTAMSLLSTNLVDYGYLTPSSAPCQPPS